MVDNEELRQRDRVVTREIIRVQTITPTVIQFPGESQIDRFQMLKDAVLQRLGLTIGDIPSDIDVLDGAAMLAIEGQADTVGPTGLFQHLAEIGMGERAAQG